MPAPGTILWGQFSEYHALEWVVRGAAAAQPKVAGMIDIGRRIGRANGCVVECPPLFARTQLKRGT